MQTKYKTLSPASAEACGYVPITTGYTSNEYELLDQAIITLGEKQFVLVKTGEGIVIARPEAEVWK